MRRSSDWSRLVLQDFLSIKVKSLWPRGSGRRYNLPAQDPRHARPR